MHAQLGTRTVLSPSKWYTQLTSGRNTPLFKLLTPIGKYCMYFGPRRWMDLSTRLVLCSILWSMYVLQIGFNSQSLKSTISISSNDSIQTESGQTQNKHPPHPPRPRTYHFLRHPRAYHHPSRQVLAPLNLHPKSPFQVPLHHDTAPPGYREHKERKEKLRSENLSLGRHHQASLCQGISGVSSQINLTDHIQEPRDKIIHPPDRHARTRLHLSPCWLNQHRITDLNNRSFGEMSSNSRFPLSCMILHSMVLPVLSVLLPIVCTLTYNMHFFFLSFPFLFFITMYSSGRTALSISTFCNSPKK